MNLFERTFYGNPLYDWLVATTIGVVVPFRTGKTSSSQIPHTGCTCVA